MKPTLTRTAAEPVSERDAAWFEELTDAVERGRVGLLARVRLSPARDTAISLIALVEAGQSENSHECATAARLLCRPAGQPSTSETATLLLALRRTGYAVRAACAATVHASINRLLDARHRAGGWSACGGATGGACCPAVTARALEALGSFGFRPGQRPVDAGRAFLLAQQGEDGAWTAREVSQLAATCGVLAGLHAIGSDMASLAVRRAVRWLKESQNADGGWGTGASSAPETARALMGLFAADEAPGPEARAGAEFLVGTQHANGGWGDAPHLPLVALARYAAATGHPPAAAFTTRADAGHPAPVPKGIAPRTMADD